MPPVELKVSFNEEYRIIRFQPIGVVENITQATKTISEIRKNVIKYSKTGKIWYIFDYSKVTFDLDVSYTLIVKDAFRKLANLLIDNVIERITVNRGDKTVSAMIPLFDNVFIHPAKVFGTIEEAEEYAISKAKSYDNNAV
jgi:hypothetical protein